MLPQTRSPNPPSTQAKLLYNNQGIIKFLIASVLVSPNIQLGLYVFMSVTHEQGVLRRFTSYQDPVYKDSCVEFFLQPKEGRGYFNFGNYLLLYLL